MANSAKSFKAPQCEKRPQQTGAAAQKVSRRVFARIQSPGRHLIGVCELQFSMYSSLVAIGLGEARRHELDKFRERVAVVEAELWPAMACANEAFGHSRLCAWGLCAWAFGGVTQDLLARSERCTLVSDYSDQAGRGANRR
jgi:hypothetical protein